MRSVFLVLAFAGTAHAELLAAGDTCRLEAPIQISAKAGGKGKKIALKAGTKVKIVALLNHEYQVTTGDQKGFGKEDAFDKGCIKQNLPTL